MARKNDLGQSMIKHTKKVTSIGKSKRTRIKNKHKRRHTKLSTQSRKQQRFS